MLIHFWGMLGVQKSDQIQILPGEVYVDGNQLKVGSRGLDNLWNLQMNHWESQRNRWQVSALGVFLLILRCADEQFIVDWQYIGK